MISRRSLLKLGGLAAVSGLGLSSYALAEPRFGLVVTQYRIRPPGFAAATRPVRIAALADIHACDPWMPVERVAEIVEKTNRLEPDLVVLLGDYVAGIQHFRTSAVPAREWAAALADLSAPLGVFAILGNHDWWTDSTAVRTALERNHIPVMENDAELIEPPSGQRFWLAGLGDQLAHPLGRGMYRGVDDLPATLAHATKVDAPVVLLAHEPDIFPSVTPGVALTLSGHTHGGQVCLPLIGRPIIPSRFGGRYAYGHIVENDRHLLVSGGIGCSSVPVRIGVPPEIVVAELG